MTASRRLAELVEAGDERLLRVALSRLVEPDERPGVVDRVVGACGVIDTVRRLLDPSARGHPALADAVRPRMPTLDVDADWARGVQAGARFVVPGDAEWPALALGHPRLRPPFGLWLRGPLHLARTVARSVAVIGSRACTAYGEAVAADLAAGLALRGWAVASGGAFGIDAAAHRAALASGGATVAVLASGIDRPYPLRHETLFGRIAEQGLLVSELPPGEGARRLRFLARNRLVAALSAGTVVVEAGPRSGTRTTARQAASYGRVVMAVPGPVSSWASRGCHELLRHPEEGAVLVVDTATVLEAVGGPDDATDPAAGPATAWDRLPVSARRLLDALPAQAALLPAAAAAAAGLGAADAGLAAERLVGAGLARFDDDGRLWRVVSRSS